MVDDNISHVEGVGSVDLILSLSSFFNLHLPKFPLNMLSVSKITRDLNSKFFYDHCVFQELGMYRKIGISRERGGLYCFVVYPSWWYVMLLSLYLIILFFVPLNSRKYEKVIFKS